MIGGQSHGERTQRHQSALRAGLRRGARRRFGKRRPEQRQLTYDIAVDDDYAPWRQWLDDQLALLPSRAADAMARKIWLDEHFWPVNFELATGAGLHAVGLRVAYEQDWDGATPDWAVLSDAGKPLAFVEVHTDQPPSRTFGQMRAWHGLVERIKEIPVPVVLQLASSRPVSPPDAGTAKKIARDLTNKLLTQPRANMFLSHGYRFLVMGDVGAAASRWSRRWACTHASTRQVPGPGRSARSS